MIMIVTAPSGLNSGVRYVMPIFVFLGILAAAGLVLLWTRQEHRGAWRLIAVVLVAWLVTSSLRAHPDYLAYFNEFGGKDPSRLLVISDLDWGQDLTRLAIYLREHDVQHVGVAYDAFYDPAALGLPDTKKIVLCSDTASGWVAVEVRRVRLHPQCFQWLTGQQRITIVGKTMWIYHLPER